MPDKVLPFTTILLLAAFLSSCEDSSSDKLRVAFSEEAHNQFFHIVQNQTFDKRSGIELSLYPTTSPASTSRLFHNGIVDFAILELDDAITVANSKPVTLIGALGRMPGTHALLGRGNIESIEDLRGQKLGTYRRNNRFLYNIFDSEGLSENDVEFVYVSNTESEVTLRDEKIDAVVALEPQATRLKRAGFQELFNVSETSSKPIYVLLASTEHLKEHGDQIPALIASWEAGLKFSYGNPELAAAILGPKIGLTPKEFENLIRRFEPNMELSTDFPEELSIESERLNRRLSELLQPNIGESVSKINLYWRQ